MKIDVLITREIYLSMRLRSSNIQDFSTCVYCITTSFDHLSYSRVTVNYFFYWTSVTLFMNVYDLNLNKVDLLDLSLACAERNYDAQQTKVDLLYQFV